MGADMNFTVLAPVGTKSHGDRHLICTPASWRDYITFYALNYFIHAATLPSVPGETKLEIVFAVLNALFIPGFGVTRAIRRLVIRPGLRYRDKTAKKRPLGRAVAAGALCMVVRREAAGGAPPDEHWVKSTWSDTLSTDDRCPRTRRVHGYCRLPEGYVLCRVPTGSRIAPLSSGSSESTASSSTPPPLPSPRQRDDGNDDDWDGQNNNMFEPSNEYNLVKVLFSLVQAVAGGITIYRARGDQITQYGYGAFGLSVVPYVFMSLVNIIASFLSPEYTTMYLVHTPDMDEAEKKGGAFSGLVGKLVTPVPADQRISTEWSKQGDIVSSQSVLLGLWLALVIVPLVIVGGLSGFQSGIISTAAQRGWIMSWLVVGSVSSGWIVLARAVSLTESDDGSRWGPVLLGFITAAPCWIPAIGGMVMVGLQLRDYGICWRVDS